jgi:hypothetical protein
MRIQVGRPRKEMLQLQQARIPTAAAEALLQRMLEKIAGLRAERDHMKAELPKPRKEYFGDDPNPPPSIKALAEVRQLAMREGWCFQHVQAISVAIDQYAEKALCNREYFLNKPYSIGGRNGDVP